MLRIIKIGGKLIENTAVLHRLCDELAVCYPSYVLIHGGGSMAGQLASRLGIETHMHNGRRITDKETLDITVMAYAGLANKKIVAALQARGVNACGLSGCDMGVIQSHKRKADSTDWGFVGDIDAVNAEALQNLLQQHVVPVLSPITFDRQGQLLNTNADSVAAAVAIALSRLYDTELIYCFDKPGVLLDINDPGSVIPRLDGQQYKACLEKRIIHSGMMPKLENAFQTIAAGVKSVRLTDAEHLKEGTIIEA